MATDWSLLLRGLIAGGTGAKQGEMLAQQVGYQQQQQAFANALQIQQATQAREQFEQQKRMDEVRALYLKAQTRAQELDIEADELALEQGPPSPFLSVAPGLDLEVQETGRPTAPSLTMPMLAQGMPPVAGTEAEAIIPGAPGVATPMGVGPPGLETILRPPKTEAEAMEAFFKQQPPGSTATMGEEGDWTLRFAAPAEPTALQAAQLTGKNIDNYTAALKAAGLPQQLINEAGILFADLTTAQNQATASAWADPQARLNFENAVARLDRAHQDIMESTELHPLVKRQYEDAHILAKYVIGIEKPKQLKAMMDRNARVAAATAGQPGVTISQIWSTGVSMAMKATPETAEETHAAIDKLPIDAGQKDLLHSATDTSAERNKETPRGGFNYGLIGQPQPGGQ